MGAGLVRPGCKTRQLHVARVLNEVWLMFRRIGVLAAWTAALALVLAPEAYAQPTQWQMNFPAPADDRMAGIIGLHNILLIIITVISLFVLGLLAWVAIRFNAKANPVPSATTHNTFLEVAWTVLPVLILTVIAIPSFRLLYYQENIPPADVTIKAIGKQWYWTYEYPDHGNFTFNAQMVPERRAAETGLRLLATDNRVVVPVGKTVRILTTASDVIHAWSIQPFGVKIDAVPGRVNQTWFRATREGIFYGHCSELCGIRHAFMPIEVEVVSPERFDTWVAEAQTRFAKVDSASETQLATAAQGQKD
jgi:cytochrome c oxidase subunit 2